MNEKFSKQTVSNAERAAAVASDQNRIITEAAARQAASAVITKARDSSDREADRAQRYPPEFRDRR